MLLPAPAPRAAGTRATHHPRNGAAAPPPRPRSRRSADATQRSNTPPAASSSSPHTRPLGRRITIATVPATTAGGNTICTRSPRRQRRRQQRRLRIHPLLGRPRHQSRELLTPRRRGKRHQLPPPPGRPFDKRFLRSLHAQLGDSRIREPRPQPLDVLRQRRAIRLRVVCNPDISACGASISPTAPP